MHLLRILLVATKLLLLTAIWLNRLPLEQIEFFFYYTEHSGLSIPSWSSPWIFKDRKKSTKSCCHCVSMEWRDFGKKNVVYKSVQSLSHSSSLLGSLKLLLDTNCEKKTFPLTDQIYFRACDILTHLTIYYSEKHLLPRDILKRRNAIKSFICNISWGLEWGQGSIQKENSFQSHNMMATTYKKDQMALIHRHAASHCSWFNAYLQHLFYSSSSFLCPLIKEAACLKPASNSLHLSTWAKINQGSIGSPSKPQWTTHFWVAE